MNNSNVFVMNCGIIAMVPLLSSVFDVDIKPIHSRYRKRKKTSKDHGMSSDQKIRLWHGLSLFVNTLGLFHSLSSRIDHRLLQFTEACVCDQLTKSNLPLHRVVPHSTTPPSFLP